MPDTTKTPLTDEELQAILRAEKAAALGGDGSSDLSAQRAKAMDYYLGDMAEDMPAAEGRSAAVSTDVADVVEAAMPELLEVFCAGEEVARFNAVGPEDEDAAQQETDYVNHVFYQENDGFLILYSFIKDALLQKTGVVKLWWEEGEDDSLETYVDLSDDVYALILADPGLEVVEHSERPGPAEVLHDVTVRCRTPYGRLKIEPVAPDEFGISPRAKTVRNAPYVFHKTTPTVSELIAAGYDRELVEALPAADDASGSAEDAARDTLADERDAAGRSANKAMCQVSVTEHYIRVDMDGDGRAELWKVTTAGPSDKLLTKGGRPDKERVDAIPFAAMTPVIMTHRFYGRSLADLVMDLQRIKTALLRNWLDNIYLMNNQRVEVAESHAGDRTLDDLLTNRPGGIIRTRQPGGLNPIVNQPIGQYIAPALDYADATREQRTGVTRKGMGLDPNSLDKTTATGAQLLANESSKRIRMIARIFAETGIRDLFLLAHATLQKHGHKDQVVKLRNRWVTVNPRNWKTRKDMTISVGLGTGSKDQQQAYLMQILNLQKDALANGMGGKLVTLRNLYNTVRKLVENSGLKHVDPYFLEPPEQEQDQPQPPPPDPKLVEAQQRMQAQQMQVQAQIELARWEAEQRIQLEREKMMMDFQLKQAELQGEAQLKAAQMVATPGPDATNIPRPQ